MSTKVPAVPFLVCGVQSKERTPLVVLVFINTCPTKLIAFALTNPKLLERSPKSTIEPA
jgi:hypothetical protein